MAGCWTEVVLNGLLPALASVFAPFSGLSFPFLDWHTQSLLRLCGAIWAFCGYVTERDSYAFPGRFAQDKEDEFPFVKARAMQIASGRASARRYQIILLGDSAIEEALTSGRDLQRRIQRRSGRKVVVTTLLAGGMNQFEYANLCGLMQDHVHGAVILQISPYHLALAPTTDAYHKALENVGFDSKEMADAFSCAGLPRPRMWGNFFLRNREFLLARTSAFTRFLKPLPEPHAHLRPKERDASHQRFQRDAQHTYLDTKGMRTKAIPNVAVYEQIVRSLRSHAIPVALLESPVNPRLAVQRTRRNGHRPIRP